MAKKRFEFNIVWDEQQFDTPENPVHKDPVRLAQHGAVRSIFIHTFLAFQKFVAHEIRDLEVLGPIHIIGLNFTDSPSKKFRIHMNSGVWVDVDHDPITITPLAKKGNDEIGEFLISTTQNALTTFAKYPNFPVEALESACLKFRQNGFQYNFWEGKIKVPNSNFHIRILVRINCKKLIRDLTLLKGNEVLFSKTVTEAPISQWVVAADYYSVELREHTLYFHPEAPDVLEWDREDYAKYGKTIEAMREPVVIDLSEYPEAMKYVGS